jgi:hypothetical protein
LNVGLCRDRGVIRECDAARGEKKREGRDELEDSLHGDRTSKTQARPVNGQ